MKNKGLQTITAVFLCLMVSFGQGRAQDIVGTLKKLHLPTAQTEQFRFPFARVNPGARPTGTEYRLIAYYYMSYDSTRFIRADDSTRLYWHPGKGTNAVRQLAPELTATYFQLPDPIDHIGYDVDSSVEYRTNASGFYTDPVYKNEHIRDGNGRTIFNIEMSYNASASGWEYTSRQAYAYDAGDHMLSEEEEVWDATGNSWVPSFSQRQIYSYDIAGQLITSTDQFFLGAWLDFTGELYGYEGNKWIMELRRTANVGSATWNVNDSITNTYDASGKLLTQTKWFTEYKDSLVYNVSGQCEQEIQFHLDIVTHTWENYMRWVHAYDASGYQVSSTQQFWVGGSWENDYRYQYLYSGNNVVNAILQAWNSTTASFDNYYQLKAEYDDHDLLTAYWREEWNPAGFWENNTGDDKYMFFYEEYDNATGVDEAGRNMPLTAYPNPAGTYLILEAKGRSIDQVHITDMTGKEVFTSKERAHSGKLRVPTAQLAAGIYSVRVQSGGESGNRMVSIQH